MARDPLAALEVGRASLGHMTAYFFTGALPTEGTVCNQNLPPFAASIG